VSTGTLFAQVAALAVVAAFSPPAMLIAALYLGSARPGRHALFFVIGGLLVATAAGIAALLVLRATGFSLPTHHQTRYGLRLALGLIAIAVAVVMARRRLKPAPNSTGPKPDEPPPDKQPKPGKKPKKPKKPNLIRRLSAQPSPRSAFLVGIFIFGPSITFLTAVQVVATAKTPLADTIAAMIIIIVLAVAFGWLPLIAYLIAPERTVRTLRAAEHWLQQHGKTIMIAAIGIVGVLLVIQGAVGLA
jgi:hypothetical protein